jgi:hypothetical protein
MADITRDWIDFSGHIKPMAGGKEGTIDAHPFVSEEELSKRRDFAGLKNEIAHGFWARQIERFYKAITNVFLEKIEASVFLNTSQPDDVIALAWKTENQHWVVLAANLKPQGQRSGSVDVYLPEGISRNHSVKDALNPQDEFRINESGEGSYSLQLGFDHKDYKILLLFPRASSPIQQFEPLGLIDTISELQASSSPLANGYNLKNLLKNAVNKLAHLLGKSRHRDSSPGERNKSASDLGKKIVAAKALLAVDPAEISTIIPASISRLRDRALSLEIRQAEIMLLRELKKYLAGRIRDIDSNPEFIKT